MASTTPVRVALIGAGYMAREHLRAFAACPDVQLLGIHSRSEARAQELAAAYPGLEVCATIAELYARTAADLVVVAVPELACLPVCEQAFQHDWTLLIEKPVGHTLAEACQIERIAATHTAQAYVALNRRFYSSTLQLQQSLNPIEAPRLVTILDQEDPAAALAAGQPPEVVLHWMFANSIHLIDYFSLLCRGEHLETQVLTPWQPEAPGPVVAHLRFGSGDIGLYQAVWNAPGPWSVAVSTPLLRAELRPIEQLSLQPAGSRQVQLQPADPLDQQFKPGLLRQAQAAIQAARGESTTLPTLAEANRSMALVASIYGMA
jgi:predicted dehydrogenase